MSENKTPILYWVVSGLLALWSLMGVMAYLGYVKMTPEALAEMVAKGDVTQGYADMVTATPAWATAVFALAVFLGVFGAIGLLLRKAWAVPLYIASLVFILISMFKGFVLDGAAKHMSGAQIGMEVVVILLGIFAVWFARKKKAKGILG